MILFLVPLIATGLAAALISKLGSDPLLTWIAGVQMLMGLLTIEWSLWNSHHKNRLVARLVGATLVAVGVAVAIFSFVRGSSPPEVSWYELNGTNEARLIQTKVLPYSEAWIDGTRTRVPVRIAFMNSRPTALTDVTVEVAYPRGYRLSSTADTRIGSSETDRRLIFEHDVDDLNVDGNYVVIKDPDDLFLATRIVSVSYWTPGGPMTGPSEVAAVSRLVGGSERKLARCVIPLQIEVTVSVYSEGVRIAQRELAISTGFEEMTETPPQLQVLNKRVVESRTVAGRSLSEWSKRFSESRSGLELEWRRRVDPIRWGVDSIAFIKGSDRNVAYSVLQIGVREELIVFDVNDDGIRDGQYRWVSGKKPELFRYPPDLRGQ